MNHANAQSSPQLYNLRDITERCRFSKSHLYNLMQRGEFPAPALRHGTRFTRWSAQEVEGWIADPAGWIARNAAKQDEVSA